MRSGICLRSGDAADDFLLGGPCAMRVTRIAPEVCYGSLPLAPGEDEYVVDPDFLPLFLGLPRGRQLDRECSLRLREAESAI